MDPKTSSIILNQKYLVKYKNYNVEIHEIFPKGKTNEFFKFKTETLISNIKFNPLVENIIIISFFNGTCKIYNILNKNKKEDIFFECIQEESIAYSYFNIFDPNKVASLSDDNNIFIWDVRYHNQKKIDSCDTIYSMKWSYYGSKYLEIINTSNEVRLVNVDTKINEVTIKLEVIPINFFFLPKNRFILIQTEKIEISHFGYNNLTNIKTIFIEIIINSNENLIDGYNILVIISICSLYFIDISSFEILKKIELDYSKYISHSFFYIEEKKICLNYVKRSISLDECTFEIDFNINKLSEKKDLINIKNNFYEKFLKKIYKYVFLLNFKESKIKKQSFKKNYMKIREIETFFNKVKRVNIFSRKDFVKQLFDLKINDINKYKKLNEELDIDKFQKICNYQKIFKIANINERKQTFIKKLPKESEIKFINDFYLQIVKLLTIDNTNKNLLEIYLFFIEKYENEISEIFGEDCIEKYNKEVEYYKVCFSKDEYKSLAGTDKKSEKEELFDFLKEMKSFQNFDHNNSTFIKKILGLKEEKVFPDFNQPLEFDCNNEELLWFGIKKRIFMAFFDLEIEKNNENSLLNMRKGFNTVMKLKLLENEDIIKNKYKLQTVLFLIISPCEHKDDSVEFLCNSLLSKRYTKIDVLKSEYEKIYKKKMGYEIEQYKNIEDICLENLKYGGFEVEEKYNFDYLLNKGVKNQDKIKQFLKNILTKKVFIEAYENLFGDDNYKLKDKKYLDEFIDNRLKFAPIRPSETLGLTDKISLNTIITNKNGCIFKQTDKITLDHLSDILYTANYVVVEEHEIFHILDCIPYYENNCSISINTPRKEQYKGKSEGGNYLELLLFNKLFSSITLGEALFLLNENNYDKTLIDFKTDFQIKKKEDLEVNGVFSEFKDYLDLNSLTNEELNNSLINPKSTNSVSVLDSYIVTYLKNDVVGKSNS